jgi:quinoprotein glucose dehydrogenase
VKAAAQPTKQAWLYVFDRVTGQPIWPIEERPVAKGDVPGEWYSPTQPFVTKPPAYDRQGVAESDIIDFTPELHEEAMKLVSKYRIGPIFTPPTVSKLEGPLGTLALPSATGGANWPGGSYDPETHTLYIYSQTNVSAFGLVPPPETKISDMNFIQGSALTGARTTPGSGSNVSPDAASSAPRPAPAAGGEGGGGAALTIRGLPLIKPPYGRITAIDLDKGEIKWQIAHGETLDNIKNNPALKGVTIPRTGQPGYIGTLVTKTLVIAGESRFTTTAAGQRGAMLRAYDKATGNELGAVYMPAPQSGSPMTYLHNGRQYIVVAISGGNYSGELIAFRLPNQTS